MERLTKSDAVISSKDINDFFALTEDNPTRWHDIYYKLKNYEDLEETKRLIEFPCAAGDIVYFIVDNDIVKGKVVELHKEIYDNEGYVTISFWRLGKDNKGKYRYEEYNDVDLPDFCNNYFSSKEEAEEKLQRCL